MKKCISRPAKFSKIKIFFSENLLFLTWLYRFNFPFTVWSSLFVTGAPDSPLNGHTGCIENVKWMKKDVNLAVAARTKNVIYGCVW